jgi:hypothetical protein
VFEGALEWGQIGQFLLKGRFGFRTGVGYTGEAKNFGKANALTVALRKNKGK